jgi:hypothetical protein
MAESERQGPDWKLGWRELPAADRWLWWNRLWAAAIQLRDRYRLGLRSGWWKDDIQVEALTALAAWTDAYDTGAWADPPGKLQLLYDLERIRALLQAGEGVFDPEHDRDAFERHLVAIGRDPASAVDSVLRSDRPVLGSDGP